MLDARARRRRADAADVRRRRSGEGVSDAAGRAAVPDAQRPRTRERLRRRRRAHHHPRSRDRGDRHPAGEGNAPARISSTSCARTSRRRAITSSRAIRTTPTRAKYGKLAALASPRPIDERVPHLDVGSAGARARVASVTRPFGQPPVQLRTLGGTVPIAPFIEALGFPAMLVPIVNFDNNQHEENENLRLGTSSPRSEILAAILAGDPEVSTANADSVTSSHRSQQRHRRVVRRVADGRGRGGHAAHHVGERRLRRSRRRSVGDAARRCAWPATPAVRVGAHPGFADLRVRPPRDDGRSRGGRGLADRADRRARGDRAGGRRRRSQHVKAHGALYNMAARDRRWPTPSRARSPRSTRRSSCSASRDRSCSRRARRRTSGGRRGLRRSLV